MPHEKIFHKKPAPNFGHDRELRIVWGGIHPFDTNVFIDMYQDNALRDTIALDEQDCKDLIGYISKAMRKTWPTKDTSLPSWYRKDTPHTQHDHNVNGECLPDIAEGCSCGSTDEHGPYA